MSQSLDRAEIEDLETEGYFEPDEDGESPGLSIRIKRYNPRKGIVVRRYHVAGQLFREDRGWYTSSDVTFLKTLADARQHAGDPESQMVFDIVRPEDAASIDARESRGSRAGASEPIAAAPRRTVTSADVAAPKRPKMIDPEPDGELSEEEIAKGFEGADDAPVLGRRASASKPPPPAKAKKTGGRKTKS